MSRCLWETPRIVRRKNNFCGSAGEGRVDLPKEGVAVSHFAVWPEENRGIDPGSDPRVEVAGQRSARNGCEHRPFSKHWHSPRSHLGRKYRNEQVSMAAATSV